MAFFYEHGIGVKKKKNIPKAIRLYKLVAEQGDTVSQCNLGICYMKEKEVPQNVEEAIRLLKLGAEKGHEVALYNLAWCYEVGKGAMQNRKKALRLYTEAAKIVDQTSILKVESKNVGVHLNESVASFYPA